ncbi:hypothetical protein P691DRAFT_796021 [Macrolepiota fuliginosa MF-IS2]|uniref:Uncharacterized protein n=1 Tax=Macrolepiota fuliginosa MF-IS2 TaxID=1400762 RepID=A0A9P5X7L2_9AGAR|nr:hypothetical protein P691DRAFT_796021 [Macrolepiota fuliginosa MF-IS2]
MSEFDSLSDSDWLDIASRASDDNDSISSHDGLSSRPLSRRSSISFGSSHESEVEAWEGLVDESGDESAVEPGMCIVRRSTARPTESLPTGTIPDISHDSSDDQRVKEALDQSMVGTLSTSRTSNAGSSTHNSIRDLRLSFPDPLTSSRDQLKQSYAEILESETASNTNDADTTISLTDSVLSSSEQEPALITNSQVPYHEATQQDNTITNMGLDIMLYGSSSPIKWSFVQDFIQKAANFSGNVVLSTLDPNAGPVQAVDLRCGKNDSILTSITVHDYTTDNAGAIDPDDIIRASLAIVYLPATTLPVLSLHTAYLPVLVPGGSGDTDDFAGSVLRHAAEDDWELLGVPANRTIVLSSNKTPVLDPGALSYIESWRVFEVVRDVLDNPFRQIKTVSDNSHPIHAVTFFALVSIIVGFAFNTAFRSPVPVPTGTVKLPSSNTWGTFSASQINRSIAVPVAGTSTALATSSLKDFSLSVLTPGVTSLSVNPPQVNSLSLTSRINSLLISTHPTSLSLVQSPTSLAVPGPSRQPAIISDGSQASSSKDVSIRGVTPTSLSEIHPEPSILTATRTQKKRSRPEVLSPKEVSLRFVDGLSEAMDVGARIFNKAINRDNGAKDIIEAMDELVNVIQTQTQNVVSQGKGKARALGEEVIARNDRARGHAKELRKKGEDFLSSAEEFWASTSLHFFERTENARQRAKGMKEGFQTGARKSYDKVVHADWDKPSWMGRDAWAPFGTHQVNPPPLRGR